MEMNTIARMRLRKSYTGCDGLPKSDQSPFTPKGIGTPVNYGSCNYQ